MQQRTEGTDTGQTHNLYTGGISAVWKHLGNTGEQNPTNETGEAKLNTRHMRRGTVKIKKKLTNTETRTKDRTGNSDNNSDRSKGVHADMDT